MTRKTCLILLSLSLSLSAVLETAAQEPKGKSFVGPSSDTRFDKVVTSWWRI